MKEADPYWEFKRLQPDEQMKDLDRRIKLAKKERKRREKIIKESAGPVSKSDTGT